MNEQEVVTATLVEEKFRMAMLPKHFGSEMMRFEAMVFNCANMLLPDYNGGYWEFHELSNGGFFMAPKSASGKWTVQVNGNDFNGVVSDASAGIIVCLFALNGLASHDRVSEKGRDNAAEYYWFLRDYALSTPESSKIFQAID